MNRTQNKKLPNCFYYTPASQRRELLSDLTSDEHVTVYCLEDATPLTKKNEARDNLKFVFSQDSQYVRAVRVNGLRSEDGFKDALWLKQLDYLPDIIIMAMVVDAAEAEIFKDFLGESHVKVFATIEEPKAIDQMDLICKSFDGLVFGSGDLAVHYCSDITWNNMLFARQRMANSSAAEKIPCIDTVSFNIEDLDLLAEESEMVRSLGFYGKAAPHPSHIPIINKVFSCSEEQISDAHQIVEMSESKGGGIFKYKELMIGPPTVRLAKERISWNDYRI